MRISNLHRGVPCRIPPLLLFGVFILCPAAHSENGASGNGHTANDGAPARIKVGNLIFSFTPDKGLILDHHGVSIIDGCNLRVRNSSWKRVYFNLAESSPAIHVEDSNGAKVITVTNIPASGEAQPPSADFLYTLRISVSPEQPTDSPTSPQSGEVAISLTYEPVKSFNATAEFGIGCINANPIKGRRYVGTLRTQKISGYLPVTPSLHNTRIKPFKISFDRLRMDSRLGEWTIAGMGDSPVLTLSDARGEHWAVESGRSVFWLGIPGASVTAGRKVTLGAVLNFSSNGRTGITALPPANTEAGMEQSDVPNARVPVESPIQFIPQPQYFEPRAQDFVINEKTRLFLQPHPTDKDRLNAEVLTRELEQIYRIKIAVEPWSEAALMGGKREPKNCILLGETNLHPGVDLLCRSERLEVSPQSPGPEGYVISVGPHYVLVAGSDRAGTFYGIQTLLQMITPRADGSVIAKGGLVFDHPDFAFRGVHLLADDYAFPWVSELITKVFSRHKINNIVLECEYAKWDSHPEIQQPWGMSKEEMRKLKELADRYYIQITPLIQSLGHCEWLFANGQNLDLAEDSEQVYAYCPSNPTCYAVLFDIYQEALDLFKPKYLHIGHDEVTRKGRFGICSRCAGKPPATLFSENVRLLQEFLAARNVTTMMWGDMLLAPAEAQDAAHGGLPYDIYEARSSISRDVVICDWHYNPYREYPSPALFAREGFNVIGATWHDRRNIFYLSKSAKQAGALGMLQTTWTGYHGNRTALQRQENQIAAYIVAADYFWSAGNPPIDQFPYRPVVALREALNHKPAVRDAQAGFLVDLTPLTNIELMDTGNEGGWLRYGIRFDLRRVPVGTTRLGSLLFRVPSRRKGFAGTAIMLRGTYTDPAQFPETVTIPISHKANALAFLLTSGWRVADGQKVGEIGILYADGISKTIDLIYGENICAWDDEINNTSDGSLWHGTTVAGSPVSIRSFLWENPTPEVPIQKIILRSENTEAAPALIGITGLTNVVHGSKTPIMTTETSTEDKATVVVSEVTK